PPPRPKPTSPRSAESKQRAVADAPQAISSTRPGAPLLSAFTGIRRVPVPENEPVKSYAPGSAERAELKARIQKMENERVDIPIVIGGREVRTGKTTQAVMPHDHKHVLGNWHRASPENVTQAIDAARAARGEWAN